MTYVKQLVHDRKHILCEKPMSLSFEELRQVSESAAHDGLVCMEALKTNAMKFIADIGHYFSDKVLG